MKINELLNRWTLPELLTIYISGVVNGDTAIGKNKCIKKRIQPVLDKYKNQKFSNEINGDQKVWMLWWQGVDSMPEMIKLCYQSICRSFEGVAEVVLLTEENIDDYVSLPQYIEEKREKGSITLTHYSDIVRFHLLNKFGGIWIDATYYAAGAVDQKIFEHGLYTIVNPHPKKENNDYIWYDWAGNWIKLPANSVLGRFVEESFLHYWKTHDCLMEYYFIDHLMRIAYDEISGVKEAVLACGLNNTATHKLLPIINDRVDEQAFNNLIGNTNFFKLTTKIDYNQTVGNEDTLYGWLIKREMRLNSK